MSKAEKIDGCKDGDQMKINKEILKKIILEEMQNLQENPKAATTPAATTPAQVQQKATRGSIAKNRRGKTASQRGAEATRLMGQEIQ